MHTRLPLFVMLAACQPVKPVSEPQSAAPTSAPTEAAASDEPAPAPVASPKRDVTVRNLGTRECKVVVYAGQGMPGADVAGDVLPVGTKTIAMAKEESLALQNPAGAWTTSGRSDGEHGEILIHPGCTGLSVADQGFTPQQVAMRWPHTISTCCSACDPKGCTGCSEAKAGAKCKGKLPLAGKCGMYQDVLDCVPATAVDAEGNVGGEYGPMQRLLQAGRDAPAK